jgi:hypothetical protein
MCPAQEMIDEPDLAGQTERAVVVKGRVEDRIMPDSGCMQTISYRNLDAASLSTLATGLSNRSGASNRHCPVKHS